MKSRKVNQYQKNEEEDCKDSSQESIESDSQIYDLEKYDYLMHKGIAIVESESDRSVA